MPFYDLNLPYIGNVQDLSRTLAFHAELGFAQVAISIPITGKIPTTLPTIPLESLTVPKSITLSTRLNLTVSDPSQNHRLASLQSQYNLIALRPTTEKALGICCGSLDCDLISLDLSLRLPFILKFKTVASALQRGIRFEICYSPGITGGSDARRNLISGATALIRATRGRGIVISSEARSALGLRGPWDVINLAVVWGMGQERGKEAVCEEARKVVQLARLKRESYRGVVDVVYGGEKSADGGNAGESSKTNKEGVSTNGANKRKAGDISMEPLQAKTDKQEKPLSKSEMKRRAKKARLEAQATTTTAEAEQAPIKAVAMPILHETLAQKQGKP